MILIFPTGALIGVLDKAPMPQLRFPFSPEGPIDIAASLGFAKRDRQVTYFVAGLPVFVHAEDDLASFRMITAQFCVNGHAMPSKRKSRAPLACPRSR